MLAILQLPDEGVMDIVRQLRVGYGLKRTLRYNTRRDHSVHSESVAEHVFALDKVEPMFELLDPVNERSIKRTGLTYRDHIEKKLLVTKKFPVMRRFVDVISADMLARGVFYADQAAE